MRTVKNQVPHGRIFSTAPLCISRFDKTTETVEIVAIGQEVKVYSIDGVSAFIWRQIDGRRSVRDILTHVLKEYQVSSSVAKRDMNRLLEQLQFLDLIEERAQDDE